jgi:hypothetical protein
MLLLFFSVDKFWRGFYRGMVSRGRMNGSRQNKKICEQHGVQDDKSLASCQPKALIDISASWTVIDHTFYHDLIKDKGIYYWDFFDHIICTGLC